MRSSTSFSGPAPTLRYYVVLLALFSFFKSTLAVSIAFQTALMQDFPNVIQCETNFDILWKGGASPWTVTITGATTEDIVQKGTVDLSSFEWLPNLAVGSTGQIAITDANQEQVTSPYTIVSNPKGDNLCALASTPLTSPNKSSSSSSIPQAPTTDTNSQTAQGTEPTATPDGSASLTSSSTTPSPTTTPSGNSSTPDNHSPPSHTTLNSGAIAGIAVGGSVFLIALVGLAFWLVRRRRQRPRFMDLGVEWTMYASRSESNFSGPDSALGPASEKRSSFDSLNRTRSAESV
ncbi:hypothetical protein C8Q80DRAFT_901663 [Daedaleopsis nitida]|nr:hypothetical protein C8Q80DRAFT_901663 [Daedaleopsis nitida]